MMADLLRNVLMGVMSFEAVNLLLTVVVVSYLPARSCRDAAIRGWFWASAFVALGAMFGGLFI